MKILSIIEATTVTGPAKNLLNFCRLARSPEFAVNGAPVEISVVTFHRGRLSEPGAVATGSSTEVEHDDSISDPAAPNAFVAAAREMGISVDVIGERYRFDTAVLSELREIVARRAPDLIQTHMIKSHFLVKLGGLNKRYPWIAYHHGYTTTDLKMRFYNQLNRWSLPSADRVITVCDAFANELSRSGVCRDRISVVHNAVTRPREVTATEHRELKRRFQIADDERMLLCVGRLSQEKGHADLIGAISILRRSDPKLKFKLLLVGDGPERQSLERAISALGVNDQVRLAGQVSDVAPYYAIADLIAMPSHSEGSPNVLLEAMAAGVPVVATNVGGVPEIATAEENALLVPARDPIHFAEALRRVLTQPDVATKLSANAAARAADFTPASYARSVIRIYQDVALEPRAIACGSYAQTRVADPVATAPGDII